MYTKYASTVLNASSIPHIVVASLGISLPRHILQFTLKSARVSDSGDAHWTYTGITHEGHAVISVCQHDISLKAAVWHAGLEVGSVELNTLEELPESLIDKLSGMLNSLMS